jgi:rhamnogalacturonyl hydrolase YesR
MKSIFTVTICLFFSLQGIGQTAEQKERLKNLIKENFSYADSQYHTMMRLVPKNQLPQSFDQAKNQIIAKDITWWCSGFYPGILLYIYEQTKDETILNEALRSLQLIESNQFYTDNHDLGFMIYCSFGNAYRLLGKEEHKKIIFNAAASLYTRYRPSIQSIQSWNKNIYFNCPVIIDNMMNLEMLNWVSKNGGDAKYANIADIHAQTTMKNHYRNDYSSFHVVDYDMASGKIIKKATHQGAANTSAWARGQAWGLYGFVMMYRDTKNKAYLDFARNIAKFMLYHPNLPEDKIPYWDFDAPLQPLSKRDASAAAITASALLELAQYVSVSEKQEYINNAVQMIESLSSEKYKSKIGENGGFMIKHCVGALPQNSEIDVPLIYADYYFLEALKRFKEWYL